MPSSVSDPDLLRSARAGDKAAFARLVERYYRVLLASCRRVLPDGDLARDAAQEAVLRAMLGLDRLRDDRRFGAWLVGIGLNVARSLRSGRGGRTSSLDALLDGRRLHEQAAPGPTPLELAEAGEIATGVRAAIAKLPAGQREAVVLFYLAGLTHAEIAGELGTRSGAVKTRLHKARRSLRAPLHLYQEPTPMPEPSAALIDMHVAELRRTSARDPTTARHILFLEERGGDRRLPIWIGPAEATALAIVLDDVQLPRPGVYQFAAALLTAAGSRLREARITELTESTFYAQAILVDGAVVDARPSDALTMALLTGAPILVSPTVIEQAARQRESIRDLLDEAEQATDDARAIADEVRTRLETSAAEIAQRRAGPERPVR